MKVGKVQHWTPFDIYLISCQMLACLIAWCQNVRDVPIVKGHEAVESAVRTRLTPRSRTQQAMLG